MVKYSYEFKKKIVLEYLNTPEDMTPFYANMECRAATN